MSSQKAGFRGSIDRLNQFVKAVHKAFFGAATHNDLTVVRQIGVYMEEIRVHHFEKVNDHIERLNTIEVQRRVFERDPPGHGETEMSGNDVFHDEDLTSRERSDAFGCLKWERPHSRRRRVPAALRILKIVDTEMSPEKMTVRSEKNFARNSSPTNAGPRCA